ncbi:MAG: hypothetical protein Q9P01_08045 [Anaerolineae bacterium]|nr:hypothetical protein [Anaerolineae bacterium]MDQ7034777.1 hypothetical protein [Anaerolineae bacterium]
MADNNRTFRTGYWLIPVLWLATWLTARHLNADFIWNDEWFQYVDFGVGPFDPVSLPTALINTAVDNGWPPVYGFVTMAWDWFTGGHLYLDRTVSLFFGLLAIAVTYQLGRKASSATVGLMSATLLGTSAFFIHHLHEFRPYPAYILAVALSGWFYLLVREDRYYQRRWVRWGFFGSLVLAFYTQHIAVASFAGIGIYHLLHERQNKNWAGILRLGVNAAIVGALWMAMIVIALQLEVAFERNAPLDELIFGFTQAYTNGLWFFVLIFIASLLRWRMTAVRFLWMWLLITFLFAFAVNSFADFLSHPRHMMGVLPIVFTLIAIGLVDVIQVRPIAWLLLGLWVGVGFVHSLTQDFVNTIPGQVPTAPLVFMETVLDTADTCITADDSVFFALDAPDEEWENDIPLLFYLEDYDFRYLAMSYALHDIPVPSLVLETKGVGELNDAQAIDRFNYMIDDASMVWVFAVTNRPLHHDILRLNSMLNDAGYQACPTIIQAEDTIGIGYSNNNNSQCERSLACGGQ